MSSPQILTPDLVQRYRKLDHHGRSILSGFAKTWSGSTIEWRHAPNAAEQRRQVLNVLFHSGDGFMDLRAIKRGEADPTKKIRRLFVDAGNFVGIEEFIREHGVERDIYFGVAARIRSGQGRLLDCGTVRALFCDIDFKHIPEEEARKRLQTFGRSPDVLIRSGGGLHVYWLLDTPCDLQRSAPVFRRHLRAIAKAIGGDIACAEPAHILRLPGTRNFKYSPPREVTIVQA